MIICGIDPHTIKEYAYAIWDGDKLQECGKTKDLKELSYQLMIVEHVYIEDQFIGKLSNRTAVKNLIQNAGRVMGICEYIGIPYTSVFPSTWQSKLNFPRKPKEISRYKWEKIHSQQICDKATEISGQKIEDDDLGSAVLIAYAIGVMK